MIYEEIYDHDVADHLKAPHAISSSAARRRLKRISIYRRIIGAGHNTILEIGCGWGDLTCGLADLAERVVGVDLSRGNIAAARQTALGAQAPARLEFHKMNAIDLKFPDCSFDWAISTSMIEHLHPDDVAIHLQETCRVLRPGGKYLVWCPNRLGHHKDRPFHLSMFSYREWVEKMRQAGFRRFSTPVFNGPPLVDARFKILMERALSAMHVKILWSHLGVRNVLLVGAK